jgi:hypothetical protein
MANAEFVERGDEIVPGLAVGMPKLLHPNHMAQAHPALDERRT